MILNPENVPVYVNFWDIGPGIMNEILPYGVEKKAPGFAGGR